MRSSVFSHAQQRSSAATGDIIKDSFSASLRVWKNSFVQFTYNFTYPTLCHDRHSPGTPRRSKQTFRVYCTPGSVQVRRSVCSVGGIGVALIEPKKPLSGLRLCVTEVGPCSSSAHNDADSAAVIAASLCGWLSSACVCVCLSSGIQ